MSRAGQWVHRADVWWLTSGLRVFVTGNRRPMLLILSVLWLLTAYGITQTDPPPEHLRMPHEKLPEWARVLVWSVPACVGLLAASWSRYDRSGWTLLAFPPAERTGSFLWAWQVASFPNAWRSALVYACIVLSIVFMARGLDRQPPLLSPVRRR